MSKFIQLMLTVAGGVAAVAAFADPPVAPTKIEPVNKNRLPEGTALKLPAPCIVDPAVDSITLTKTKTPGSIIVKYVVKNKGSSAWASGANQQNVSLIVKNGNTGRTTFSGVRPLPGSAAAGAQMLSFTTPIINNAIDTFEFSGSVDVQISYDPDILLDAKKCNDDANSANNRKTLGHAELTAFLGGTATSKTFN